MKPEIKKQSEIRTDSSMNDGKAEKNSLAAYDPFARDSHSESEIQAQERENTEKKPGSEPVTPGNLPPERNINPIPEIPVQHEQDIPSKPIPEINITPQREVRQPDIPEINEKRNYDNMSPTDKDNNDVISRVYPSIMNHDNLEGRNDEIDENWEHEDKDLDIDADSNRLE